MIKKNKLALRVDPKMLFKEGDFVHERIHPTQKLIVRSYENGLYYCEAQEAPNRKKLVFFERELIAQVKERTLIPIEVIKKKDKLIKEVAIAQMKVG